MEKKLVIIEDDEVFLDLLGRITERLDFIGFPSDEALELSEVLELWPDLILLDQKVNNKLGGDLRVKIKTIPNKPHQEYS